MGIIDETSAFHEKMVKAFEEGEKGVQLEMQDCYHKAEPDEPKFTLLARDPVAPNLIRLWAAIREGETQEAMKYCYYVMNNLSKYSREPTQPEKVLSACLIADQMEAWSQKK